MAMVVPSYRAEGTAFEQMVLGNLGILMEKNSWVPRVVDFLKIKR